MHCDEKYHVRGMRGVQKSLFMLIKQISDVPVAIDAVIAYALPYPLGTAGDHLLKKENLI